MDAVTFGVQLVSVLISLLAFAYAAWLYLWVKRLPSSNARIAHVGRLIREGARTFLRKEYLVLARFALAAGALIFLFLPSPLWSGSVRENVVMTVAYFAGTVFSAIAGKIGIEVATIANIKAAEAAQKGIRPSFMAGFRGGAVMGMAVVGASLIGVTLVYLLTNDASTLLGFSFGASSLALFAKAGGGIFTGHGRLMERPQGPYFQLFDKKGIFYEQKDGVLTVRGALTPGEYVLPGNVSSQFFTGLLFALPLLDGVSAVVSSTEIESQAYITMTLEAMRQAGLTPDFAVSVPETLPLSDTDLAALLGNALDNAMEAAAQAEDKTVTVRCKAQKGLFMLRVENALAGPVAADLATTKADKSAHGLGLPGMREIASRYGGTLEAGAKSGRFELLVCIPV